MNKLGVVYNVFDGEELLPYSIKQIRSEVDFIVVVYQSVSNFRYLNPKLLPTLRELKEKGMVDMLYEYTPNFDYLEDKNALNELQDKIEKESGFKLSKKEITACDGSRNETEKRNIGLKICRANGCSFFITIDCDELYITEQFRKAKEDFLAGGYDTSFCKMLTFYKLPTMQLDPPEEYYVPLFYKIKDDTEFRYYKVYPVMCDPTRRVQSGHPRIFNRDEIQMYHYSYVRNNLSSKLNNSSIQESKEEKKQILDHFKNWKSKEDGAFLMSEQKYDLIEVENLFKIKL